MDKAYLLIMLIDLACRQILGLQKLGFSKFVQVRFSRLSLAKLTSYLLI